MSASISVKPNIKEGKKNIAIDTSTAEMYRLQNQNRIFTQREKKKFSPYFNFKDSNVFDMNTMEGLINNEIDSVCSNKGWKMLPKSMKWDKINSYYDNEDIKSSLSTFDIKEQKDKLRKALVYDTTIKLDYDMKSRLITKIYELQ